MGHGGAGTRPETENEPVPASFAGDFVVTVDGVEHSTAETSFSLTGVSALSITVRARQLGRLSPPVALTVPAGEGVFYAGRAETFFRGQ